MDSSDGLLVIHGTGTGKTLTAITTSQCYLDRNPGHKVVFIGPTSLISNFTKEMENYGDYDLDDYELYSFNKFYQLSKSGRPVNLKNKLLIIDEVHNLRNPDSLISETVVEASFRANKRVLLSATPFVNNLEDFIPTINIVHGDRVVGRKNEYEDGDVPDWISWKTNEFEESLATVKYLLRNKIDVVLIKDPNDFPERIDERIEVPMSDSYYKKYLKLVEGEQFGELLFKNPKKYYNGYRRAVNQAGPAYFSEKIKKALPILKRGKSILYTNWLEFGIEPVAKILKQNGISYRIFSGKIKVFERQKIINDFNKNKFDTLILTKAGGEGLDTKGVRNVVVLDPTWNDAGLQQIIGRAIRYKSHAHLPESQRVVNVYFMMLTIPKNIDPKLAEPSGDVLLYSIIDKKKELNIAITSILEDISIK